MPCFGWRTGEYRFDEGVPNIVGEVTADIPVLELTLERCRREVKDEDVSRLLRDTASILATAGLAARDAQRLRLFRGESLLMARAEEGAKIASALAVSPALRDEIGRAAAALIASGIVSLTTPAAVAKAGVIDTIPPALRGKVKPAVSEPGPSAGVRFYKQMHDLLIGADYYKTLGLDTNAAAEDIRRSYLNLAKEIHPDRFLSPPLDALHQDMEELFAQVLEAYNTLSNPDARARYDAERTSAGVVPKQTVTDQQALAKGNFIRGRTLYEEGKMAESLKFLQNAVELEPNRPEYLRLLGIVQARNPRLRLEAEASLLKAIELDPARAEGYLHLGLLYRRMGETPKAIEKLRECLKWDPSNMEAGTALAEMTRTVGNRA